MIFHPRPGQPVQLWYAKKWRPVAPLHGLVGTVAVVARCRKPKNHGVVIAGRLHVVPCGNLRPPPSV